MQLWVYFSTGGIVTLTGVDPDDLIEQIKDQLEARSEIPIANQMLSGKGRKSCGCSGRMQDGLTLRDHGITEDCEIHCHLRLPASKAQLLSHIVEVTRITTETAQLERLIEGRRPSLAVQVTLSACEVSMDCLLVVSICISTGET